MQKNAKHSGIRISEEDSQLFRESVTGTRPIPQDKIPPVVSRGKRKTRQEALTEQTGENLFYFSDQFEGFVSDGSSPAYIQPGDDPHLTGRLKRGEFQPQVVLDLHGMSQLEAKTELASLLAYCEKQHFNCACVVHGKGLGILAHKVPNWLIQHPNVRAFHSAPRSWGRNGALLVLLKLPQ